MDNLTHSLVGLGLSRAGLNRLSPHGTAILIISANAPDIDILAASRSALAYLETHRGYTHSLFLLPVVSLLPVLVTAGIFRQKLPWLKAWFASMIGVGSHLLIDWTNSYGVRLLLPFSSRWSHLDWVNLYDGFLLVVLLFAAVWPWFARMVSREIGDRASAGRGIAVFALVFFVLFDCARAVLHLRAVSQLQSRLYNDAPAIEAVALPDAVNPFRWTGIVETAIDYRVLPVNTLGAFDPESIAHRYFKLPVTAALVHAKDSEPFRFFLYFARFPVWSESPVTVNQREGTRIELTDLRFGIPGAGSFHVVALEDNVYQVLGSWFTFGSGATVGWGDSGPPPASN